jgi:tetratricopeptide (TPR) repeat protein
MKLAGMITLRISLVAVFSVVVCPAVSKAQDSKLILERKAAIDQAEASEKRGDVAGAERLFMEAVDIAGRLSSAQRFAKDDALKSLAEFYQRQHRIADATRLLEERVAVPALLPPELLGLAYFDLASAYGVNLEVEKARSAADRAVVAYRECIENGGALILIRTCDRRLADIQGLIGFVYFNAKEFGEAEPWLKAIVDRGDELVRPEFMLTSLRAYAIVLAARGETAEAARFATRAVQFEKDHPGSNRFLNPN